MEEKEVPQGNVVEQQGEQKVWLLVSPQCITEEMREAHIESLRWARRQKLEATDLDELFDEDHIEARIQDLLEAYEIELSEMSDEVLFSDWH